MINKERESGFTLVELLVVILVIGILAAIAIPAFMDQRKRANDAAVEADVKNVAIMVETWMLDNPNEPVPFDIGWKANQISIGSAEDGNLMTTQLSDGVQIVLRHPAVQHSIPGNFTNIRDNSIPTGVFEIESIHTNGKQYAGINRLTYRSDMGGFYKRVYENVED